MADAAVIRVLIVDDEAPARKRLRELLAREPDVEIAGECANGPEAVIALEDGQPDLLLLDIQMPEMDGFDVLRSLPADRIPATIFVTAFDEFALRAFDVHAVDYLLKPVAAERFSRALSRARDRLRARSAADVERILEVIAMRAGARAWLERLVIREVGRIGLLPVSEIEWIEAADNYVRVHTGPAGTARHVRMTLRELEQRLDPARFARVHRSAVVALDRIRQLEPWSHGDYIIVLHSGARVPASRTYGAAIRRILNA